MRNSKSSEVMTHHSVDDIRIAGGVVHAYMDQKLLKSNKIMSFN
jgi:hypothetical protein